MRQVFLIPEDKKVKFAALREDVISSPFMGLKTLQCFSGKVISFSFSIQRCRLYVLYCIFKAISRLSGSTRSPVKVEAALRAETEYWRFLDNWRDCFPWRTTPLFIAIPLRGPGVELCKGRSQFGVERLLGRQLAGYQYFESSGFAAFAPLA